MEAQSIRTLTMFSPLLLHFHINLRLVRVVVGVCMYVVCCCIQKCNVWWDRAAWSSSLLHWGPIDDSNPEQGRIELATLRECCYMQAMALCCCWKFSMCLESSLWMCSGSTPTLENSDLDKVAICLQVFKLIYDLPSEDSKI